jgi:hypothetical protein
MRLRKLLGSAEPILCLWCWCAENAPGGDLTGLSDDEIERAAEWLGKPGAAVQAFVDAGLLDGKEGEYSLHEWMEHAGKGLKSLSKTRDRMRKFMQTKRQQSVLVSANTDETLSLSSDPDLDPDPELGDLSPRRERESVSVNVSANKTSHDWLSYFQVKYWEIRGRQYGRGTSDAKALGNFGELLDSLPVEQRAADWQARERIVTEFLQRSDARTVQAGWPFSFFATDFRGLALPPDKRPVQKAQGKSLRADGGPGPPPHYWSKCKGAD